MRKDFSSICLELRPFIKIWAWPLKGDTSHSTGHCSRFTQICFARKGTWQKRTFCKGLMTWVKV